MLKDILCGAGYWMAELITEVNTRTRVSEDEKKIQEACDAAGPVVGAFMYPVLTEVYKNKRLDEGYKR